MADITNCVDSFTSPLHGLATDHQQKKTLTRTIGTSCMSSVCVPLNAMI